MDCSTNSKQIRMLLSVLTLALVFFSADSELTKVPCCNNWSSLCTRSNPPLCRCDDLLLACPPTCVTCEMSPIFIYPPRYQCRDWIVNYCGIRCTPKLALSQE